MNPSMQTIEFQNKKLAFYKQGKGNYPIVLVHGFCEDSRMWDDFIGAFEGRYIIRVDLPGFGGSEVQDEHTITNMAECVNVVLTYLKVKKCVLVGHSMGGYVGLEFAKKHPEKLVGLCMFHTHPYADSDEKKKSRTKGIEFISKHGHILYVRQLIPKLFAYDYSKGYPFEVNKLIYNASKFKPEGITSGLEAMRDRADNSDVLRSIKCPVQFIIGKKDVAVSMEQSMGQTHLPNVADIRVYDDVGHRGMFEAKSRTRKALKEFLKFVG
jgi:pimeloyl-ACP methyl ester carboxylesterase